MARRCIADAAPPRDRPARPPPSRLDAAAAAALAPALDWREFGEGAKETLAAADPLAWGDFVLRRKDGSPSYHLAVVVDDAAQGVSDVVRGRDLLLATSAHRLLQELLTLPAPRYRHHRLVLDADGAKMSKSAQSTPLAASAPAGVQRAGSSRRARL